jgi:putative cell wall-binding protein
VSDGTVEPRGRWVPDGTRRRRYTLLVTALVVATLLVPGSSAAQTVRTQFPKQIDPYQPYDPQTVCDPGPKPGVVDFANMLLQGYPGTGSSGISRDCGVRGRSEHKEGRAFDWAVSATNPAQRAVAESALSILLATDEHGNRHAYFRRFGLMYIIWNRQIFSASNPAAGWRPYACNPAASYDDCHTGHVHFSFSSAGAQRRTTWWTIGDRLRARAEASPSGKATVAFERIAGPHEVDTAIAVSTRAFPTEGSAEQVFLADAGAPHEAMVAAVLAGAFNGAVLVTEGTAAVEPQVDAEVRRLLGPEGLGQVTFVGGPDALPDPLLRAFRNRYTVRRIAGADQFATARLAADEVETSSQMKTAVVIGTSGVLDALPMVAVAAANDWPVVFTEREQLPVSTREFLVSHDIEQVHIAGPPAEVSHAVADEIADLADITVERHHARDRYETAVVVAERFFSLPSAYAVASGTSWSDAVVGAAYAGERRHAPVLLTDGERLADPVVDYIERSRTPGAAGLIIGDTDTVDPAVGRQLRRTLD